MASGIRATVKFPAPNGCPIARFTEQTGAVVDQVSASVTPPGTTESVTEFLVDADHESADGEWTPIFSYGTAELYRTTHDDEQCPCETLGDFGCPVHRYVAEDGDVTLVFHAEDFEQLQELMAEIRERFPAVDVRRLLQPPLKGAADDRVFVNRGKLTDRQLEVLQTALQMGYFDRPKGANATEIASELGIAQATFTEHLGAAQRKLLEDVFDA